MKIGAYLYPGLLASEIFFPILDNEALLLDKVKEATEGGFYRRIEISAMKTAQARGALRQLAEHIPVTQWITNDLNALGLNPSAVDAELRGRTVRKMAELIDTAAQSGADRVSIISCQDPGPALRAEAAKALTETLCVSAEYAKQYGITLMLEPLDRGAHKNNFIGPTDEAVEIIKKVHETCDNVLISWDAAHVALNKEDVVASLTQAFDYVGHIHLANAVLDSGSEAFGDWHMPMGAPGFLTEQVAVELARRACRLLKGSRMAITVECRSPSAAAMADNERTNRLFLRNVLEQEAETL